MPVFDVGYRPWSGERESAWRRVGVIATTGIRLAWKNQWLRRMLFVAWLPAIYFGIAFFAYERALEEGAGETLGRAIIMRMPEGRLTVDQVFRGGAAERRPVWAFMLMTLFRYPQGLLMVMLVGLIAPPLISRDLRTRSHLLYFSRPLGITEYVLGKAAVVGTYLFLISTLPAVCLYVLGVLLSPSFSVVGDTWDLPLRVCAASVIVVVPTTAIALALSSLTEETRYASFGWFAIWVVGWVAHSSLMIMDAERLGRFAMDIPSRWTFVSLYHTLGDLQSSIFGFQVEARRLQIATAILTGLTLVSLVVVFRRMWVLHRR